MKLIKLSLAVALGFFASFVLAFIALFLWVANSVGVR